MTANSITNTDTHPSVAPKEAWDAIATGYDSYVAPGEAHLAQEALTLVGLKPTDRFLDVAAGPGGLSLPAARSGARVLATDWSPAMIERFEARVREEALAGAEGQVMDCHALDILDAELRYHRLSLRRHAGSRPGNCVAGDGARNEARRARNDDRLRITAGD